MSVHMRALNVGYIFHIVINFLSTCNTDRERLTSGFALLLLLLLLLLLRVQLIS